MSTSTIGGRVSAGSKWFPEPFRALALVFVALLTVAYVGVFYQVTDVVGGTESLVVIVTAALVAGVVLAGVLGPRLAVALAAVVFAAGLGTYVLAVPNGAVLLRSLGAVWSDVLALLTGLSILRITAAGAWILGFAPAPIFLSWYFAMRERYVSAVVVGGVALSFFVLTGDAPLTLVLLGAIGAAGAVGFGELEAHGGGRGQAETVAIVLGAMVAVAVLAPAIPGGAAQPLLGSSGVGDGGSGPTTIEAGLVNAGDQLSVLGSIRLSPKVRFSVESNDSTYWRTGAYDRYTGDGWVRTGSKRPYSGSLPAPPRNTTTLTQRYTPATGLGVLPAAWKPTRIEGLAQTPKVTELGGIEPGGTIHANESYTVRSQQPDTTPDELRRAGTDYPTAITSRGYTQLPGSTPDWVGERTSVIARNAKNPYDTARTIERWLETTKNYSLNVTRPDGNVAAGFLSEMDAGYCTYFATTMVTMLRTQNVPARFVTGYTPGQRVADDEWVVRGLDSHAWVEVYFPGSGWVSFDPTPAGPRTATEDQRVESAREDNASNVDTDDSADGEWTTTPVGGFTTTQTGTENATNSSNGTLPVDLRNRLPEQSRGPNVNGSSPAGGYTTQPPTAAPVANGSNSGGGVLPPLPEPSRKNLTLGAVLLFGVAAAAHRSGATERAYRAAWLRYRPTGTPDERIQRTFTRLEYLLARRHRPRRPGETPREYLAAVGTDSRVRRVGDIHERARYGGGATDEAADEAAGLVDALVGERTPILGRLRRRGGDSI